MNIEVDKQKFSTPKITKPRRRHRNPVPAEGQNGVFSQTWWPICMSVELDKGAVLGKTFLDGKVVVFRGEDGVARVMSAYCPHLGADLSVGQVVENRIQCAFHKWEFADDGFCEKTGVGDIAPPNACVYAFPTQEKYGIIWAFNGEEPTFDIPSFEHDEEDIIYITTKMDGTLNCDGWCFSANTPDFNHIIVVHKVDLLRREVHRKTDHSREWNYDIIHWKGETTNFRVGIHGTNIFMQNSEFNGRYGGVIVPFSCPAPGQHEVYFIIAVLKGKGEEEQKKQEEWLKEFSKIELEFGSQDVSILNTIHYMPGTLTKSDEYLAEFLNYLRSFPRCHPAADFLN